MWYPTLAHVLEIHERIASFSEEEGTVRDRSALDRLIVAPQREGGSKRTLSNLARKAASLIVLVVQERPFKSCNEQTAYALASAFLDRNGAAFNASLDQMGELFYQISDGTHGKASVADWIQHRITNRYDARHARRIVSALDQLAAVIEDLETRPGLDDHAKRLDRVGNAICAEVTSIFHLNDTRREHIRESYPGVDQQWGAVFDV